jgi:pyruvate dehydrogenase E2 component (dihydrolipoamide acetyltransferase)
MLKKVIMPTLGLDMESAVIQTWLKREGDPVERDEPIVLVETDKASTEITAPATGVLRRIVEGEGSTVPVTQTIAMIETGEHGPDDEEPPAGGDRAPAEERAGAPGAPDTTVPRGEYEMAGEPLPVDSEQEGEGAPRAGEKLRASPAARRAAEQMGVELARVKGTGPGGRIQGDDVRRFAERQRPVVKPSPFVPPERPPRTMPGADLPGRLVPLSRKRRLTAERMSLSARTVARLTLNMDIDATEMIRVRSRLLPLYESRHDVRLSYNDILVKAVATALREHPYLNARWTNDGIYLTEPVNVGVAAAVEDGLVVPVVRNADRKSLPEISRELGALLEKAKEDRLGLDEITGGTFTITNLGMYGIDSFTPIVNPPEAAILGVGRIVDRAAGRDGQPVMRPTVTLSLSFDHRIVDGAPAAQFLQAVQRLLEEPYLLI